MASSLTAKGVTAAKPGRHGDGNGLYLVVAESGARKWVFRYTRPGTGRVTEMGLGSANGPAAVALADARAKASANRKMLADGVDPNEGPQTSPRFVDFAAEYIADRSKTLAENSGYVKGWKRAVKKTFEPIANRRMHEITTQQVVDCLKPTWETTPFSTKAAQTLAENVIDAARVLGHIPQDRANVARWKGHLDKLLRSSHRRRRKHHAALPYVDVPAFYAKLGARRGISALAFQFLILTVPRTSEVVSVPWSEIDVAAKLWTVPAERMKMERDHVIPLSPSAMRLLEEARKLTTGKPTDPVFPGAKWGKGLSSGVFDSLIDNMKMTGKVTAHGCRSSFRDWAGDCTEFPREIAEAALAHAVGDETERAYRRGTALAKRRKLMDDWDTYVTALTR